MNRVLIPATILSLCLWATGCKNDNKDTEPSGHHKMADQNMQMATAMIEPTKGNSAKGTVTFHNITISGQKNPIVGHALIVHANPDDGSQPTGNAGARIGCGIIKAGGK